MVKAFIILIYLSIIAAAVFNIAVSHVAGLELGASVLAILVSGAGALFVWKA